MPFRHFQPPGSGTVNGLWQSNAITSREKMETEKILIQIKTRSEKNETEEGGQRWSANGKKVLNVLWLEIDRERQ